MTRIISGTAKGFNLVVPSSARPTADMVREALFSTLEHRGFIEDCAFLDVFAGSGACALEALSRGASSATAVDLARSAYQAMTKNAAKTGLALRVVQAKAESFLLEDRGSYDVIFIDPPYDLDEASLTAVLAAAGPRLVEDGLLVVERSSRSPEPAWPEGFEREKQKKWGDTSMWTATRAEETTTLEM